MEDKKTAIFYSHLIMKTLAMPKNKDSDTSKTIIEYMLNAREPLKSQ